MGMLSDFLAAVDSTKRVYGRKLADLLRDPKGVLQQNVDNAMPTQYEQGEWWKNAQGMMANPNALASFDKKLETMTSPENMLGVGMTAWHGSPHKFSKFDLSKIGTGEGAQAYGHGLYLAESPEVARQYQKLGEVVSIGGKPVSGGRGAAFDAQDGMSKTAVNMLGLNGWNVKKTLDSLGNDYSQAKSIGDKSYYMDLIRQIKQIPQNKIDAQGGHLYKTDIPDEAVARFLDWDKPLSQQAEVLAKVKKLVKDGGDYYPMTRSRLDSLPPEKITGQELYDSFVSDRRTGGAQSTSNDLRYLGIPGIRYLDGGSRGTGQGTSNFVVFDPNLIRILERNGEATGLQPWKPGEWQGMLDAAKQGTPTVSLSDLVRPKTEFEIRHEVAQRNAALPVEQGGLGLPPNNTAMDRAKAMDMEPLFHGATKEITQIDPNMVGSRISSNPSSYLGFFSTPNTKEASRYPMDFSSQGGNVMPLMVRRGKTFDMTNKQFDDLSMGEFFAKGDTPKERFSNAVADVQALKNALSSDGYESITRFKGRPMEEVISMNPANIRSRFAAFDPFRRNESDLLAGVAPWAIPGGLFGLMMLGNQERTD